MHLNLYKYDNWYQVFPTRFCKAYLPLIPVFDLGAQLDSNAKIVPQSQSLENKTKISKIPTRKNIPQKQTNLNVLQKPKKNKENNKIVFTLALRKEEIVKEEIEYFASKLLCEQILLNFCGTFTC